MKSKSWNKKSKL